MESSKKHTLVHPGQQIPANIKEIQGHPFKRACSVVPVLIALDSLCLQIQVFTEQVYLLCPEGFP